MAMQIRFRINNDSEAVFTENTRRALLEQGDIVALDWVKDMLYETTALYNELHEIVFSGAKRDG
jgi:hypothetical protein